MANLKIDANVTAPKVVTVPLVRGDYVGMSSTFRVCFEVALAIASAVLGSLLNAPSPVPMSQWLLLVLSSIAAAAFIVLERRWKRNAQAGSD